MGVSLVMFSHYMQKECYYLGGNVFEQTRITLQKWLILIYWWVRELAVTDASEEAEVSKHVGINVYQWLWEY